MRVEVNAKLLRWAADRSMIEREALLARFPRLEAWERGEAPTLKQLENFARATHAPIGYFFLPEPPVERLPIPDFRTFRSTAIARPSPDLLDTIHLCQQRQDWYREFARLSGQRPIAFSGAGSVGADAETVASAIRSTLHFDVEERRSLPTWTDALRHFIQLADDAGVLVMVSGVVGSNNRRKLDPEEFRGFALADPIAPLVFINGSDTKAGQMFTLAHELAHVWIGHSALTDAEPVGQTTNEIERWCNAVAAELLVPLESFRLQCRVGGDVRNEMERLARVYKVSTLVILPRMFDADCLDRAGLRDAYAEELARLRALSGGSGGNFYLTLGARASKRFALALVTSTLEGRSSFTEAFRLLGFKKMATFRELGHNLGLVV